MKFNFLKFVIASAILVGAIFACDPQDPSPIETSKLGSVKASINSNVFESVTIEANLFISGADSTLELVATDKAINVINLRIDNLKTGTYAFNGSSKKAFSADYKPSATNGINVLYPATTGNLILSSIDANNKLINGTFQFETKEHKITNGKIAQVKYTEQNSL
jgi:Family of unknown function (DUF6252)